MGVRDSTFVVGMLRWSTARSHFSALRMHFKCAFAAEGWQNIFCSVLFNRDVAQYKKELDREARSAATILQEQLQVMVEDLERELVAARFAVAAAPGKRLSLAAQRRVLQETVVTKLAGERVSLMTLCVVHLNPLPAAGKLLRAYMCERSNAVLALGTPLIYKRGFLVADVRSVLRL